METISLGCVCVCVTGNFGLRKYSAMYRMCSSNVLNGYAYKFTLYSHTIDKQNFSEFSQ